ncbi:MAG TPA: hypothetical protein VJR29_09000 [bacterium]|nr:hypothetical protein [bacterium]
MDTRSIRSFLFAGLLSAPFLFTGGYGLAQYGGTQPTTTAPAPAPAPGASQVKDTQGGGLVTFDAKLVDPAVKAKTKSATVDTKVAGTHMVDPDSTNGKPAPGQNHLHYQLDNGPIIATTATKLSFHNLSPGPHTIKVTLAENDHTPVGRENVLTVTIP